MQSVDAVLQIQGGRPAYRVIVQQFGKVKAKDGGLAVIEGLIAELEAMG